VASIDRFTDSLARALSWGAAWDMTRDAEMRTTDWLELVLRGLPTETDSTAARSLVGRAGTAVTLYSSVDHRRAAEQRWDSGLLELVRQAPAGDDRQLAFVRGLAGSTCSAEGLGLLSGLLDGSETLPGLTVDTDLRWELLQGLAREGHADEAAIEAELQRDKTITGQESAAAARAAMPTAEAKAWAWDEVQREDIPNETMRSIAWSFHQPRQDDVLQPYVERYLAAAEHIWEERGVHYASTVLEYMFPRVLATQQTLDTVDAWLASTSANAAARRLVSEGRDDVARALAAQRCDGG
jgi:aminopeptidase N